MSDWLCSLIGHRWRTVGYLRGTDVAVQVCVRSPREVRKRVARYLSAAPASNRPPAHRRATMPRPIRDEPQA